MLITQFLTARRRLWRQELPHAELPVRAEAAESGGLDDFTERAWMWQALSQLPRQQRAVLVLRYFEDLTEAEIAAALRCSAGTAKSHATRGLERLRKVMSVSEEWSR